MFVVSCTIVISAALDARLQTGGWLTSRRQSQAGTTIAVSCSLTLSLTINSSSLCVETSDSVRVDEVSRRHPPGIDVRNGPRSL